MRSIASLLLLALPMSVYSALLHGPLSVDQSIHGPARSAAYKEDAVLRFNITSEEEARSLNTALDQLMLDVWEANREWADIRIGKSKVEHFLSLLPRTMRNGYTPLVDDVAQAVYESQLAADEIPALEPLHISGTEQESRQSKEFSPSLQKRPYETNIFFSDYQPLSVITPWMRLMQSLFPTHVRIVNIGSTYEGRSILGLKVGVRPRNAQQPAETRKTVLITGGSHAREWISVSSVLYAAYSLITGYGKSKQLTKYIEEFDWVFLPTINPDGYARTWEQDRLWRKNTQETFLPYCEGYDLDRSFAFEWDGERMKNSPCSESFAGELPFQAIEALRLANWVTNETINNDVKFVGFLDLHSYSQQILYPYAFSCIQTPPSLENLEEIGLGLAKAIHQHSGEFYGVTSACEGNVAANSNVSGRAAWPKVESNGGTALDWMYHEIGVKYAFQIKLPDTGSHGFLLPRKFIIPTGGDVFAAISYLGGYLLSNKGVESIERSASARAKVTETEPLSPVDAKNFVSEAAPKFDDRLDLR